MYLHGIYSREIDLQYAVKSLGITSLGLVGETLRGPAFQPMLIENWRDFVSMFGSTSTEKFAGSQYPKYELPYIAKSYLSESNQLQVCRVLGLSGYNAGPAWLITADVKGGEKMVVAVLRSRGYYEKYHKFGDAVGECKCPQQTYDRLFYHVGEIAESSKNCGQPLSYNLSALKIEKYSPISFSGDECNGYGLNSAESDFSVSPINRGRFKLVGVTGSHEVKPEEGFTFDDSTPGYFEYPVTLNPNDKDYILKVLGTDPQNGDTPIYVESLYDVALIQAIEEEKVEKLTSGLTSYQVYNKGDFCGLEPVDDLISKQEESLTRRYIGKRFLADKWAVDNFVHCHPYDYETKKPLKFSVVDEIPGSATKTSAKFVVKKGVTNEYAMLVEEPKETFKYEKFVSKNGVLELTGTTKYSCIEPTNVDLSVKEVVKVGQIYTVQQYTDENGKRHYFYRYYKEGLPKEEDTVVSVTSYVSIVDKLMDSTFSSNGELEVKPTGSIPESRFTVLVKNIADGKYYRYCKQENVKDVYPVNCDLNDYRDSYRFASTPWIVSNIKGDGTKFELNKLFRFHTISDGNSSNNEIKVSIQNIKPDEGIFDVIVRDINDTDDSIIPLEKFSKCSLVPGDGNYIAYKIGSYDGTYESKSKFITVEVNESMATRNSIPSGFLGYPMPKYSGIQVFGKNEEKIKEPFIKYNLNYDIDVKHRKQYFGLSSLVGVDIDLFTYKGNASYSLEPDMITRGFHLDSRLNLEGYGDSEKPVLTVDGVYGYEFDAVSTNNRTNILNETPLIGTESEMEGSIFEYTDLRKFTVYFYGGFDGWDSYRNYRSNTDEFKMTKYKGDYNEYSGEGFSFNKIANPEELALNQQGITSDWYAYLSAIRQFANPEAVDINVFATPGIDLFNNKLLAQEAIEMIEEERADSVYVATVPDKPFGAADYVDEMYTPEDMVYELEDTEIDSNYTCTYYPWIKYEDVENNQYIYLPATKDVVRNMAKTDNKTYPWFAPAGVDRGDVKCVRAHYVTKLADEDMLYEGRINPIKTFASDGVKVWGQKNLQVRESQLNRIAIRRLLLRMRKLISIACIGLIFEPNDATTKNKFLSTVTPILDNIKSNRGISDYKIEVNDTIESRERRELPAKLYFKAYNALEYITLDFILTPEGVSFDAI